MKRALFPVCIIFFLLLSVWAEAQKPEKIITFARVPKTYDYYNQQVALWKKEISKNKKNEDAWYNYYFASRYAFIHYPHGNKNFKAYNKSNDSLLKQMEKNIPNSFSYNYINYREHGLRMNYLPYLEKAHKINPERTEAYTDLAVCYEVLQNISERDKFLKLLYEKGDPSPGLMNYNYNVISGLEPNTILLTTGDNDTYPIWIMQAVKGYRKDITVLNTSVLLVDEYRNKMFTKMGIDTGGLHGLEFAEFTNEIIKKIGDNSKKYPLAIALTCNDEFPKEIKDNLYLTGLTMQYAKERLDNVAVLKKNFEQKYALDYLQTDFVKNDGYKDIVKIINANYIVPAINLYEHYKLAGETEKANRYKIMAQTVGKGTEQEEQVKKYFSEN